MNWQLILVLALSYTTLFFLLGLATRPGMIHLRKRFHQQFGLSISEDAINGLSQEQRETWNRIYFYEYSRTPYRWIEVLSALFHYPSIIALGAILKRPTLNWAPMYFITGIAYIAIFYLFLR